MSWRCTSRLTNVITLLVDASRAAIPSKVLALGVMERDAGRTVAPSLLRRLAWWFGPLVNRILSYLWSGTSWLANVQRHSQISSSLRGRRAKKSP